MKKKKEEAEFEMFMPGDWVEWTSQSRGVKKTKKGQVLFWIPRGSLLETTFRTTVIPEELRERYALSRGSWRASVNGFSLMCDPWEPNITFDRCAVVVPTSRDRMPKLYTPRVKWLVKTEAPPEQKEE